MDAAQAIDTLNAIRPPYRCGGCGLAVVVLSDGTKIRACDCHATIIADAGATVTSHNLAGA